MRSVASAVGTAVDCSTVAAGVGTVVGCSATAVAVGSSVAVVGFQFQRWRERPLPHQ
ncbi:MAG: hypothetical protein H6652_19905 [Ardenticatenaceae bacterium]|nr:hypothetical protein [Ardenticatenaceae bacterium]